VSTSHYSSVLSLKVAECVHPHSSVCLHMSMPVHIRVCPHSCGHCPHSSGRHENDWNNLIRLKCVWLKCVRLLDGFLLSEAGSVDFDRILPWRQQTGSGVPQRFPMWRAWFVEGLWLTAVGPVDFGRCAHWWPLQTTTSGLLTPWWKTPGIDQPSI